MPFLCHAQADLAAIIKEAELGNVHLQSVLGCAYASGQGVSQDYVQAVYWLTKAATKGNADAQYNLGLCYESGLGVAEDRFNAAKFWRRAAEKGHARAQYRLAMCYTDGKWIKPDPERASHWLSLAIIGGYSEKQHQELSRVAVKNENDAASGCIPAFSLSSFGSSDLPIVSYEVTKDKGHLTVDIKQAFDKEKLRDKMIKRIETACSSQNIALRVGEPPPKGATYTIISEKIERTDQGELFTIMFKPLF